MIKVLIVEDSKVVSQYLEFIFSSDPDIQIIGVVGNGKAAVEFLKKNTPDIITMDIDMPVMNGLEATRIIMSTNPMPIIIVTASRNSREVDITMEALAAGALSVIEKPLGIGHQDEEEKNRKLITMVKLLSEVRVVRRIFRRSRIENPQLSIPSQSTSLKLGQNSKIVGVGISSGGPQVLEQIFNKITDAFPYPIVVVQHITEGFLDGLVRWLARLLNIPVQIAVDNEKLLSGHIYFAPDSYQLGIFNSKIKLVKCKYEPGKICPSIAHFFNSLAAGNAENIIALLMTGMGKDGAKELKKLNELGATTIAQNKESSLVHGMPGEAIKLGAVDLIKNPTEIADMFFDLEKQAKTRKLADIN